MFQIVMAQIAMTQNSDGPNNDCLDSDGPNSEIRHAC